LTRISRPTDPSVTLSALGALVAALAFLALLAALAPALAAAGPYVDPSPAEIRAKLKAAGVARDIPPKILYGIAYQESGWRQFDAGGDPLIGSDGKGIGIMQVTTIPDGVDVERLKTDIDYNIAVGADILVTKWGYAPTVFPVIGDGSPHCYEHWFFAVWAYNGLKADNPYPDAIWQHIADGHGLWTGQVITPVPDSWLVGGLPPKVPSVTTPQPEHWWSPAGLPRPTLSAPRVQKRVAAGARFTVSGTLSPQHLAGAHSVELRLSRRNGGRWVLRRTVVTTNRDSGAATRWAATFALGKAGRWKVVAYAYADADHAAATSRAARVTVRR
jgi:hypothetical protein